MKSNLEQLNKVKYILKKGKLEKAIGLLENLSFPLSSDQKRTIEIASYKHAQFKLNKSKGILSNEQLQLESNIIANNILDITDGLINQQNQQVEKKKKKKFIKEAIQLAGILLLIALMLPTIIENFKKKKPKPINININSSAKRPTLPFSILVYPFISSVDQNKNNAKNNNIHHQLASQLELLDNVKVFVEDSVSNYITYSAADSIGKSRKVDLMVWGNVASIDRFKDSVFLNIKYHLTKDFNTGDYFEILQQGQTEMIPYDYYDLLKSGSLTLRIEDIVNWALGNQATKNGNWEEASNHYDKLLKSISNADNYVFKAKDQAVIMQRLGSTYSLSKQYEQSKDILQKAIVIEPDNFKLYHTLGMTYYHENKLDSSYHFLSKAIELNPNDHNSFHNRAFIFEKQKRPRMALKDLNEALRLQPDFYFSMGSRGDQYDKLKEYEKALDEYQKAIELADKQHQNNYLASIYHAKKSSIYIRMYLQGLKLNKSDNELPLTDKAYTELVMAKRKRDTPQLYTVSGFYYYSQKDWERSIRCYSIADTMLTLANKNATQRAYVLNGRAASLMQIKQYEDALKDLEKALKIKPKELSFIANITKCRNALKQQN